MRDDMEIIEFDGEKSFSSVEFWSVFCEYYKEKTGKPYKIKDRDRGLLRLIKSPDLIDLIPRFFDLSLEDYSFDYFYQVVKKNLFARLEGKEKVDFPSLKKMKSVEVETSFEKKLRKLTDLRLKLLRKTKDPKYFAPPAIRNEKELDDLIDKFEKILGEIS